MLKTVFNIISLFILASSMAQGQNHTIKTTEGYGIEKKITLDASKINSLKITNQHGNITLTGWEKDTVEVHTLINVNAPGSNSAQEVLSFLSIERAEPGNQLIFRTQFDTEFFSNYPFNIDYTIHLPYRLMLDIQNGLGDVLIQNIDGQIALHLDYGKLHLINSNNQNTHHLNLKFVEAKLESCQSIKGNLSNCTIKATEVNKVDLKSEYSLLDLKQTQSITLNSSTDRININQSDSITITGTQLLVNCKSLNQFGFIEIDKGQLTIEANNNLSQLSISNKMANTNLSLPGSYSYFINGEVSQGHFIHPNSDAIHTIKGINRLSFTGKIESDNPSLGQLILFNDNSDLTIKTR